MKKSIGLIIPARSASSRFPNKPLALIAGKIMIQRVWENASRDFNSSNIWIATDCKRIYSEVEQFGGQAIMTPSSCLTGTDRIAEANKVLNFEYVINIQGDEPILEPWILKQVLDALKTFNGDALNCMSSINNVIDFNNINIPKVVVNADYELIYISRSPIPLGKDNNPSFDNVFRQVCIYAFSKDALKYYGCNRSKSSIENIEDIEILRLVENKCKIKMIEVESSSVAVDLPEDIIKVESILKQKN
jgi:3-deoxy-manno-octulosonate cytidylyltransferase (CMP-KDO synthetase)